MGIGRSRRGIDSFPCEGQTGSHSGPEVRFGEVFRGWNAATARLPPTPFLDSFRVADDRTLSGNLQFYG